jgi:hypothetical protein
MLHNIHFEFMVCKSQHFACVCMYSDVLVCVVLWVCLITFCLVFQKDLLRVC